MDFTSRSDPRREAFHGIDLSLLSGNLAAPGADTGTSANAHGVSYTSRRVLLAFAKGHVLGWAPYMLTHRATMAFDAVGRRAFDLRRRERALFTRAPWRQPGS